MIRSFCLVLILMLVGCSSTPAPEPDPLPVGSTEPAPPPPRRVYIGDVSTKVFHREGCPECESIDLSNQRLFETPGEALDGDYSRCPVCEPLRGW